MNRINQYLTGHYTSGVIAALVPTGSFVGFKAKLFMKKTILPVLAILAMLWVPAQGQTAYRSASSKITVEGTSTLHDWEMTSSAATATASFTTAANGTPTALSNLNFTMGATSIKSGKSSMDNNAYKALNTSSFANFTYTAASGTVTAAGGNNYTIRCNGTMTIAGKGLTTDLVATGVYNPADGSITVTGTKKLNMTNYGVKPPSFMMGAVTTGEDLTIKFNMVLKK
jgi:hypothetical protein